MKKFIASIIGISLISSILVGCNSTSKSTNSNDKGQKIVTYKVFSSDTNANADNFESPVAKKITEKTGVRLDIEYNVSGDEQEKLSLMAASGQYPDIIFGKGNINIIKNAGGLIALDELIEQNAPNIKALYGDYINRLRWSKDDPKIYVLPTLDAVNNEYLKPSRGVFIQHAVMKELNYPEVKTVTDLENLLKAYYEAHPQIEGQDTIPLMLNGDDWLTMITVTNPACFMTGAPDDGEWYVNPDTFEVQRHLTRPVEREYFRWLNHMNDVGLLYQESFIQKTDSYKSKIASGRVLAVIDADWDISEPLTALRQAGLEDRMYGIYPVTFSEEYKQPEFMDPGYSAGYGLSISTNCKSPENIIKFIDTMCTEEMQILLNWGIEREHYTTDENGKRTLKPEIEQLKLSDPSFPKKTGIDLYTQMFPNYGNKQLDSKGNPIKRDSVEQIIADQTDIEKEVLVAYGAKTWKDLYPSSDEFPVKKYGVLFTIKSSKLEDPEIKAIDNRVLEIGYKRIVEAILAPPDKFDSVYDTYLKEIEAAGLPQLTEAINEALQERLELWK